MLRLITKFEGFLGVAQLLTQYAKRKEAPSTQHLLSGLMQDIEILRSCIQVGEAKGYMSPGGTWAPLLSPAYRVHSIEASDRAERTMEGLVDQHVDVERRRFRSRQRRDRSVRRALFSRRRAEHQRAFALDGGCRRHGDEPVRQAQPTLRALAERRSSTACVNGSTVNTKIRRRPSACSNSSRRWTTTVDNQRRYVFNRSSAWRN